MLEAFKIREEALEEAFFAKRNREQIAILKANRIHNTKLEELESATGIQSQEVLDELIDLELDISTVSALTLAPLVAIAWMDLDLSEIARHDVMEAAREFGIGEGSPAERLLISWLDEKPPAELMAVWTDYAKALVAVKGASRVQYLKNYIYRKSEKMAKHAGGFLGIGTGLTSSGKKVLKQIEDAFSV